MDEVDDLERETRVLAETLTYDTSNGFVSTPCPSFRHFMRSLTFLSVSIVRLG